MPPQCMTHHTEHSHSTPTQHTSHSTQHTAPCHPMHARWCPAHGIATQNISPGGYDAIRAGGGLARVGPGGHFGWALGGIHYVSFTERGRSDIFLRRFPLYLGHMLIGCLVLDSILPIQCMTHPMTHPIQVVDEVVVPDGLEPGDYLLSWRWDCEQTTQIWQVRDSLSLPLGLIAMVCMRRWYCMCRSGGGGVFQSDWSSKPRWGRCESAK